MRRALSRGQGLVEAGIVIALIVTVTMGIIEFGRAFMITNMITHAARDGARMAAVVPVTGRDAQGTITDTASIISQVKAEIANVVPTAGLSVAVTQPNTTPPTVQVTVTGNVNYIFNLVGTTFAVSRTATFRDEGR